MSRRRGIRLRRVRWRRFCWRRRRPDTVIGIFPSDHVVKDAARFAEVMRAGVALAASGRKDCGAGGAADAGGDGLWVYRAGCGWWMPRWLTVGSSAAGEAVYGEAGSGAGGGVCGVGELCAGTAGFFCGARGRWRGRFGSIRPAMAPLLEKIAAAYGTPEFERVFAEVYPQCENISIDYAVLEPRSAKGEMSVGDLLSAGGFWRGTIWGAGRRCMSMWRRVRRRSCRLTNVIDGQDPLTIVDRFVRELCLCSGEGGCAGGGERSGGGADRRMLC